VALPEGHLCRAVEEPVRANIFRELSFTHADLFSISQGDEAVEASDQLCRTLNLDQVTGIPPDFNRRQGHGRFDCTRIGKHVANVSIAYK
jgi:hypothetical protein